MTGRGTSDLTAEKGLRWGAVLLAIASLAALTFVATRSYFFADDFSHVLYAKQHTSLDVAVVLGEPEYSFHYRPLVKTFFLLGYWLFGLKPVGYVLGCVAIFALILPAYFGLTKAVSGSTAQGYLGLLLFLVQANTYVYTVNWMGAVGILLSCLFIVVALGSYCRAGQSAQGRAALYLVAIASYTLAVLSKESAIPFAVAPAAMDVLLRWPQEADRRRALAGTILRSVPFVAAVFAYLALRFASGAPVLVYQLELGTNILRNLAFHGMHLGFIPGAVLLFWLIGVMTGRVRKSSRDLRTMALGLVLAALSVAPVLLLPWSSPTWLLQPALGVTLMASTAALRLTVSTRIARAALVGVGLTAVAGILVLSVRLHEARYLQWGNYTRSLLTELQAAHPTLEPGTTVVIRDDDIGRPYGADRLLRNHATSALRLLYGDLSLEARVVPGCGASGGQDEPATAPADVVVVYSDGHLVQPQEPGGCRTPVRP